MSNSLNLPIMTRMTIAITTPTMLLLPLSSVDSFVGVMNVMVMTSERVYGVMVVLGFTKGAVGVEAATKSDDKVVCK